MRVAVGKPSRQNDTRFGSWNSVRPSVPELACCRRDPWYSHNPDRLRNLLGQTGISGPHFSSSVLLALQTLRVFFVHRIPSLALILNGPLICPVCSHVVRAVLERDFIQPFCSGASANSPICTQRYARETELHGSAFGYLK
jgi:hypothetical protein